MYDNEIRANKAYADGAGNAKMSEPEYAKKRVELGLVGAGQTLMAGAMAECAARQSAKGFIQDRIYQYRRRADELQALSDALPGVLHPAADSALYELVSSAR